MKKNLISIIIPVYNGAKFIDKCLNSLINQSYKNFEVIVVDDGSKDNSLELIKNFENKYEFIKAYHKKNEGLSITRNYGISKASGEFITVLDVDDWFDKDFLKTMITDNEKYDVIIGGYRRVYNDGKLDFDYVLSDTKWNKYRRVTVWAKLYKLAFLKKNKIYYPDDRLFGEDVVYTMRCMSQNPKIKFIPYIGYNNLINEESITHVDKNKIKSNVPKMISFIDEYIYSNKKFLIDDKKNIKYYYLKIVASYLVEQADFLSYESLKSYYKNSIVQVKKIFKKYNYNFSFVCQKDEPFKVNCIINIMILFEKLHLSSLLLHLLHMVFNHENK